MKYDSEMRLLAAIAYGESSVENVYEEMAAIASVMVRQMKARGYKTMSEFTSSESTFSFVVGDGNMRFSRFSKATDIEVDESPSMSLAIKAAKNAWADGVDHSNGAYFWDGADIKSRYKTHRKVKAGIHFSDPKHNIYDIKATSGEFELSVVVKKRRRGKIVEERQVIGTYPHIYESTAAHGGTIFWKLGDVWLKLSKGKAYR